MNYLSYDDPVQLVEDQYALKTGGWPIDAEMTLGDGYVAPHRTPLEGDAPFDQSDLKEGDFAEKPMEQPKG